MRFFFSIHNHKLDRKECKLNSKIKQIVNSPNILNNIKYNLKIILVAFGKNKFLMHNDFL